MQDEGGVERTTQNRGDRDRAPVQGGGEGREEGGAGKKKSGLRRVRDRIERGERNATGGVSVPLKTVFDKSPPLTRNAEQQREMRERLTMQGEDAGGQAREEPNYCLLWDVEEDSVRGDTGGHVGGRFKEWTTIERLSERLFNGDGGWREELTALMTKAFAAADENYGMREAAEWGGKFVFDRGKVTSDEDLVRAAMLDVSMAARMKMRPHAVNRLSEERIWRLRSDNEEIPRLLRLSKGAPVFPDPDLVPNGAGEKPPLRKKYLATAPAVNKMIQEAYLDPGLALIVSQSFADSLEGLHYSPLSWAPKWGKKKGRPITDCSDGGSEERNAPLNSPYTKEVSDEVWGTIEHPTIEDLVRMVMEFFREQQAMDPSLTWADIRIWCMDLRGAYNLISFHPDDVHYLASQTSDEKVIIFLVGIFGWTGTPAAFQVVTRAIVHELKHALTGKAKMYVDDIFGVCLVRNVERDMKTAKGICEDLLGTGAVEDSKSRVGERLDVIGYTIDLAQQLVTVAEKNVLRAIYGFSVTGADGTVTVKEMQRLASWASRYSKICERMKPFVRALYRSYCGRRPHARFTLPEEAQQAIRMFQAFFALTVVQERNFTRSFQSFTERRSRWIVVFDASLTGLGVLWYRQDEEGRRVLMGGTAVDLRGLEFGEPAMQNVAEFIAATVGICGLEQVGARARQQEDLDVELEGDSVTALTWSAKQNFRSELVGNAAIVHNCVCLSRRIRVSRVRHIEAALNWRTDHLSRQGSAEALVEKDPGMSPLLEDGGWITVPNVDKLLALCDPRWKARRGKGEGTGFKSEEEFLEFWGEVEDLMGDRRGGEE